LYDEQWRMNRVDGAASVVSACAFTDTYLQFQCVDCQPSWLLTPLRSHWKEEGRGACVYRVATNMLSEFVSQRLVVDASNA